MSQHQARAAQTLLVTYIKKEPPDSKVNSDVVCVCVCVWHCCFLSCCAVALVTGLWLSMGWPVEQRIGEGREEGSKNDGQENSYVFRNMGQKAELLEMKGERRG